MFKLGTITDFNFFALFLAFFLKVFFQYAKIFEMFFLHVCKDSFEALYKSKNGLDYSNK